MFSARAGTVQKPSDAMRSASIRGDVDKACMVVSSLRQVGLSYTLGIGSDAEEQKQKKGRPVQRHGVERSLFLGASAMPLLGAPRGAHAQAPQAAQAPQPARGDERAKPHGRGGRVIAPLDLN